MWGKLRDVDGWVRNRLRYCIWKDWKKPERKRKSLIRLGVDQHHAYAWPNAQMWLGHRSKSHPEHHDHSVPSGQTRLRSPARSLPESRSTPQRTAVYEARLVYPERSRRVQWCERRTPSLSSGGAAYSIGLSFYSTPFFAPFVSNNSIMSADSALSNAVLFPCLAFISAPWSM